MATRTRLPRQAAQETSYADAAGSGSSSEDEEYGRKRAKKGKGKGKARAMTPDESDDEEDDEEAASSSASAPRIKSRNPYVADLIRRERRRERRTSPAPEPVEYEVKRVDFSKTLPVEMMAEILSYLGPKTLYELSFLSKTLYAILTSPTVKPVWKRAYTGLDLRDEKPEKPRTATAARLEKKRIPADSKNRQNKLPAFHGKEVVPYQLAVLISAASRNSQNPTSSSSDASARTAGARTLWVSRRSCTTKKYERLHAATLKVVPKTSIEPDRRLVMRCTDFVHIPDLYETSDMLEEIDYAADDDRPWRGAELDLQSVGRDVSRATKLANSWRASRQQKAAGIEQRVMSQFSSHVRKIVEQREADKPERDKLTRWIVAASQRLDYREQVEREEGWAAAERTRAERFARVSELLKQARIFETFSESRLATHPLVKLAEPLTEDIWKAIAPANYHDLGRAVAKDLVARGVKKKKTVNWDKLDLPKQPKAISDEAWAYIQPALAKVVFERKKRAERAKEIKREDQERARQQERLDSKHAFFRARYDDILADIPSAEVKAFAPCFRDFLHLDSVKDLYQDDRFATEDSEMKQDSNVFIERLEAIRDEMNGFAIDLRLHALRLVLAGTTDASEDEIKQLDAEVLSDPRFDDDFFLRPSSWIDCGVCSHLGPLVDVLKHWHDRHEPDLPRASDSRVISIEDEEDEKKPDISPERLVQLSLEVACAWSALLELGRIGGDDPSITKKDINKTFKPFRFIWENDPRHTGLRRETWDELLASVKYAARCAYEEGASLPPPLISMKNLNSRERRAAERDAQWARFRGKW